jgi:hypothetical protein
VVTILILKKQISGPYNYARTAVLELCLIRKKLRFNLHTRYNNLVGKQTSQAKGRWNVKNLGGDKPIVRGL